jgi:hypothetical protein
MNILFKIVLSQITHKTIIIELINLIIYTVHRYIDNL